METREKDLREKIIEAAKVCDSVFSAWSCEHCPFHARFMEIGWDECKGKLRREMIALLKQEDAISIAWLQNRVRMYLAVRDKSNLSVAAVLNDTIMAWRKEQAQEGEARTHAKTPEAAE